MGKKWIAAALLAVLAAGCAAPTPTATPTTGPIAAPTSTKAPTATPTKRPVTKVTVAISGSNLAFLVPLLARAKGYFVEEGLDIDWSIAGGAQVVAAVVGNSADFSLNAITPEVIKAIDAGQKVKEVAVTAQRGVLQLVLNKDIAKERGVTQQSSLADKAKALKGLTIAAFSVGGSTHNLLKAIIAEANLDPERDLTVTFIGSEPSLVAAMSQGQIQGFVHALPTTMQPVAAGYGITLVSEPDGDMPLVGERAEVGMLALEQIIANRSEIIEGAIRAIWRAERFYFQDQAASAKALRTLEFFTEIDEGAFNLSVQKLTLTVPKDPIITEKQFNDTVKWYNSARKAEEQTKITFKQFFDDGPALKAKQQLGF
ncbi:MAG: ABC transporter substrate-binding protein [Chloroflexi bacterium]|nr:ABC transporter substrate-binding protein [Chloroflexota bacterium]